MQYAAVAPLLLQLAVAFPQLHLQPRQAADLVTLVVGNITQTGADTASLNNTLNGFSDNATDIGFNAIALLGGSTNVQKDLNLTAFSANTSSAFTSADSGRVVNAVEGILPTIFDTLNNFVAHCQAFLNTNLSNAVLQQLEIQRELAREEGNAIGSKLDASYTSIGSVGVSAILSVFDSAISVFSQTHCPTGLTSAIPPTAPGATSTPVVTSSSRPTVTSTTPVVTPTSTPVVSSTPKTSTTPIITSTPKTSSTPVVSSTPKTSTTPVTSTPVVSSTPKSSSTPVVSSTPKSSSTPVVITTSTPVVKTSTTPCPESSSTPKVSPPAVTPTVTKTEITTVEKTEPASTITVEKTEPASTITVEKTQPASTITVEKTEPVSTITVEKTEPAKTVTVTSTVEKTAPCVTSASPSAYAPQPYKQSSTAPAPYQPSSYAPNPYGGENGNGNGWGWGSNKGWGWSFNW